VRILAIVSGVGRGHAARTRPILEALAVRGHDCTAAALGRRAASLLAPACPVVPQPADFHRRVAPPADDVAYACIYDFEMSFGFYQRDVEDSTSAVVELAANAIETARPDLVAIDQVPPATAVARSRGLPVVQITHGPLFPAVGPWAYWLDERPPELRYPPPLPAVNRALEDVGVAPIGHVDELLAGDLTIVPTPPGLGTAPGALHVDVPTLLDGRPAEVRRRPGRPLVALLLGTKPRLAEEAARGALAAGADVVALEASAAALPEDPGVQRLAAVDAASLLRQVDAAVHHGGSGSIVTCLQAGAPSIAVPTQGEQDFNAHRLAELGLGRCLPVSERPLEAVAIRDGVVTLAHREPNRLAERIAEALADLEPLPRPADELPGVEAAAAAIEALG
jgi:hypothetical protein